MGQAMNAAIIAKEHYQEHPEELGAWDKASWNKGFRYGKEFMKPLVSIDEVLRVFDEANGKYDNTITLNNLYIRKALENMGGEHE